MARRGKRRNPNSIHYVYFLRCPITMKIRYVGVTISPKQRLSQHKIVDSYCPESKKEWITMLRKEGKSPIMEIVNVARKKLAIKLESHLIKTLRENGVELVNRDNSKRKDYILNQIKMQNNLHLNK